MTSARIPRAAAPLLFLTASILGGGGAPALAQESDPSGGAQRVAAAAGDPASGTPARASRLGRFLDEHGVRLLLSLGLEQASRVYDRTFGPSHDPILFADPPAIDRRIHDSITGPSGWRGYVEEYGLETLRYAVPLTLIALDLRDRPAMKGDLLGLVETYYTNRGLTSLLKDMTGRERPALEFARREGAGDRRLEALDANEGNHESFPSGHASGSFAFLSYLERAIARKTDLRGGARAASFTGMYGLAGYIGYSRIRRGRHFFTDVVAGAALGTFVGRTYYRLNHPGEFASGRAAAARAGRLRFHPPYPVPGGAGISLGIEMGSNAR